MAVMGAGSVTLYRRVGREMVFWRVVAGEPDELARAVEIARELDLMASGIGGWAHALVLGLNPTKPVHPARISTGVFPKYELNRRF